MSTPDRSKVIFDIASNLINGNVALSEQEIDSSFIFRFEYGWQLRLRKIRSWLNRLARISDSPESLPSEISPKMWAYLETTKHLMDIPDNIFLEEGFRKDLPFRPYDQDLNKKYDLSISAAISGNRTYLEEIWPSIEEEKQLVDDLQNAILLAAQQYQIVPLGFDLWNQFALKEIELALVNLRNYFLFDYPLPRFIWPYVTYIETKIDEGVIRWLRPDSAGLRKPKSHRSEQLRRFTRIRTWSVFFLSRRGGGTCFEHEAVDMWNFRFMDNLAPRNFRSERSKLLQGISRAQESG